MNIHFDNYELFESLRDNSIFSIEVGSNMYGLNDENSDRDILHIYPDTVFESSLPYKNIHQLQYNGADGNDYLFVSLKTFITNIISGDSTINWEVIHTENCKNSIISFLYENRTWFYNYSVAKSFIGMAKRDIKYFHKRDNQRLINKGYLHILRGIYMCEMIMEYWKGNDINIYSVYDRLKEHKLNMADEVGKYSSDRKFIDSLNEKAVLVYASLNEFFNHNKNIINHKFKPLFMQAIVEFLHFIPIDRDYVKKERTLNPYSVTIVELYNDAFENWVNY